MWHCRTAAAAAAPRAPPHTLSHYSHTCAPSLPRAAHPVLCWRPCPSPHTTSLQLCGAPTALLAPPPALLHHEPCHDCLHLMAALSIAHHTRAVSSPFHGNTYRGTHIRARSPGGLTAWPGDLALNPNPGPAQSTHVCQTRQVDARTPIRDVHPPRDDALCRQRLGAPIGRRGARSQSSPRRFCAPRPALKLWGGAR